jgi:hypothetical protein
MHSLEATLAVAFFALRPIERSFTFTNISRPTVADLSTPFFPDERTRHGAVARWGLRVAALVLAYWLCGRAGPAVSQLGTDVTLVWPPAGIALAALLRWGLGVWPGSRIGAFPRRAGAEPTRVACGDARDGSTLGPTLAAMVLRREGLHCELDRRRDLWLYGAFGVLRPPAPQCVERQLLARRIGRWPGPTAGRVGALVGRRRDGRDRRRHPAADAVRAPRSRRAYGDWRWIPSGL